MADFEEEDETAPSLLLLPCTTCSRTFRPQALAKHIKYCEKTLIKKRKIFDSARQRVQGTDLAEFLPVLTSNKKKTEKSPVRKIQSKWKEKHMELVRTIRAARIGSSTDQLPPPAIKPADHEQCPHCERFFGPKAFDRHLEWCKEHSTRIQPKSPASVQAKERLEARTKYRAPMLIKSRRSLAREKYQPPNQVRDQSPLTTNQKTVTNQKREPSPMDRTVIRNSFRSQVSSRQNTGPPKGEVTTDQTSRLQSRRNSRKESPAKKVPPTNNKPKSSDANSNPVHKEAKTVSDTNLNSNNMHHMKEDIFTASCNITPIKPKENLKTKMKTTLTAGATFNNPSNNHNSALTNMEENECSVKRKFIRRQKVPVLNDIKVNNDIAGMTVTPCRTASRPMGRNKTSEIISNVGEANPAIENETLLNLTCTKIVEPVTEEKVQELCPPVPLQNDSLLLKMNSLNGCKENILTIGSDIKYIADLDEVNDDINSKPDRGKTIEYNNKLINTAELSDDIVLEICDDIKQWCSLQMTKDKGKCEKPVSKLTNKNDELDSELYKLNLQATNLTDFKGNEMNDFYKFNNSIEEDKHRYYESPFSSCHYQKELESILDRNNIENIFSPTSNKRRKYNHSSETPVPVEVLYKINSERGNESSVCNEIYVSKGDADKDIEGNSSSSETTQRIGIPNNEFCLCCTTDLDVELCKDCQRSRSDTDLTSFYNKTLLKCCLQRKNKLYAVKQTCENQCNFNIMNANGTESVTHFSICKELPEPDNRNEELNSTCQLQIDPELYKFVDNTNDSKSISSLTFVIEREPLYKSDDIACDLASGDKINFTDNKEIDVKQDNSIIIHEEKNIIAPAAIMDQYNNMGVMKLTLSDLDACYTPDIFPYKHDVLIDCSIENSSNRYYKQKNNERNDICDNPDGFNRSEHVAEHDSSADKCVHNESGNQIIGDDVNHKKISTGNYEHSPETCNSTTFKNTDEFSLPTECPIKVNDTISKQEKNKKNCDNCSQWFSSCEENKNTNYEMSSTTSETACQIEFAEDSLSDDDDVYNKLHNESYNSSDFDYSTDNYCNNISNITYNDVHQYGYTNKQKQYVYHTEISHVESHTYQEINSTDGKQSIYEYTDSLEHTSFLPSIISRSPKELLWKPSSTNVVRDFKQKKEIRDKRKLKTNEKTRFPKLTTWQLEANKLPPVHNKIYRISRSGKENKSFEAKTLPKFTSVVETPVYMYNPKKPDFKCSEFDLEPQSYGDNTENCKQTKQRPSTRGKNVADSAYNSLNRRSPMTEDTTAMDNADTTHAGSSSGSECSLPPLAGNNSQAAKFCHECGAKYPVLAAKFCCQCGVRRLVI